MSTLPPSLTRVPVLVLGGGLAGLSAARHLQARGTPYKLIERQPHVGGHAVTVEEDGYRFDRTGHLLHLRDPALESLVRSLLGDELLEIERRSRVYSHGVYTRYPFQANVYGLPADVARECLVGFVRAHFDRAPSEPRDFESFILRHFGEGVSKHFMVPYNQKMWGVHPREITAEWCNRFVPLPSLDDVVRGAVGASGRELGYNARFLYPRRGIAALADALARDLSGIETGRTPVRIDLATRTLHLADGDAVPFDALVSTIPLQTLIGLVDDAPADVKHAAATLRCNPVHYLDIALTTPPGHDFHWAYVPEPRLPFYRVGCYSNFSPDLVPPGCGSLYVELASRETPDEAAVLPGVLAGLVEMRLLRSPSDVRFARLRRIDFAYVVFDHHYFESLAVLRPFLAQARILSTGRYGAWNYSAMGDALAMGRDAAGDVDRLLGSDGHA